MILQQAPVTVEERLRAIRGQFRDSGSRWEEFAQNISLFVGGILGIMVLSWTYSWLRKQAFIREQSTRLSTLGFAGAEVELYRRVARHVPPRSIRRLAMERICFDRAAALLIQKTAQEEREQVLGEVLSLRRRLPFASELQKVPAFVAGGSLQVGTPDASGGVVWRDAYVLGVQPRILQIGFPGLEGRVPCAVGSPVQIRLQARGDLWLGLSRMHGRSRTNRNRVVISRPAVLRPARLKIQFESEETSAQAEFLERFPKDLQDDSIPRGPCKVLGACSQGVITDIHDTRLRQGESVRISGKYSGLYRNLARLRSGRRDSIYFLIHQSVEPASRPESKVEETEEPKTEQETAFAAG